MSSSGTPNQPPFDTIHKFFKPSSSAATATAPPPQHYIYPSHPPPQQQYIYPPHPPQPAQHPQSGTFHPLFYQPYDYDSHFQRSLSYPSPPPHPAAPNPTSVNASARLMALLSVEPSPSPPPQLQLPQQQIVVPMHSGPMLMPSRKVPRGRHLRGVQLVYDVDVRLQGEMQPQLEVTPITKYISDPRLVIGRQIAVNNKYICYGLNQGNVRVLNINTALRHLLKGHGERVTDMAFFAEEVHLLASASVDGRVYVWKIMESSDEEDKPEISAKTVIALQIMGDGESVHPRVCWHCHKQEVLVVGIGKQVLRIDTTMVGKSEDCSAENPLKCHVDKLVNGVRFVGKHEGEVTDLSMCQWMTSRLVSASADGRIKIWDEHSVTPLAVLRAHDGLPVNSARFLTSPHRPDHIILITGGPLNREVKIWALESNEGWFRPTDAESWKCMQTLELRSSAEHRVENAFFNQVAVLPQASLLLLANAKKNAIYAVHLECGPCPAATRIDYIAEFTVTMPILSFIGSSTMSPQGEHTVQVYCVQTQAIQQYDLDLGQCLPPPQENAMIEKTDSTVSPDAADQEILNAFDARGNGTADVPISVPKPTTLASGFGNASAPRYPLGSASNETASPLELSSLYMELKSVSSAPTISGTGAQILPVSPKLCRRVSDLRGPTNGNEPVRSLGDCPGDQHVTDYSNYRQMDAMHPEFSKTISIDDDSRTSEKKILQDDTSSALTHPITFQHPTHLVTPYEILMSASSSESPKAVRGKSGVETKIQDVVVDRDTSNSVVEVKFVGESGPSQNGKFTPQGEPQHLASENKYFFSQASDLGMGALSTEAYIQDAIQDNDATHVDSIDSVDDVPGHVPELAPPTTVQQLPLPSLTGNKQKGKDSQELGASAPSPNVFDSADSSNEPGASSSAPHREEVSFAHLQITQMLTQVLHAQKEMQKQMATMVAVAVTKEGKRLEATLGRNMEKSIKANCEALWARIQEENSKNDKLLRERTQQLTNVITNVINKELPTILEKIVKKEVAAIGQTLVRTISPAIEKAVTSTVTESFQRGVGDKAINQLEKSINLKLDGTVARHIQVQFQTSGRQALQESLKWIMEVSLIPAFEKSCKGIFELVDATFQKGMVEHTAAAQRQFESSHSQLALALREAINSATSVTQTLTGELADSQRKMLAYMAVGANPSVVNPSLSMPVGSLPEKVEVPVDPTKELSVLIAEHKYDEAFTGALHRNDVSIVSWLCSQVNLHKVLSMFPLPLSQGVLLSLLQQLACDISNDTSRKLSWMTEVAAAINPTDPMIAVHVRPIIEQVYQILNDQRTMLNITGVDMSSIRLLMHVINSMLMTCI